MVDRISSDSSDSQASRRLSLVSLIRFVLQSCWLLACVAKGVVGWTVHHQELSPDSPPSKNIKICFLIDTFNAIRCFKNVKIGEGGSFAYLNNLDSVFIS